MKQETIKPKILNLSDHKLTSGQVSLLFRGPKFCPTTEGNATDFCGDNYAFGRKLEIHEIFFNNNNNNNNNNIIRKPSKKYISSKNKELTTITAAINKIQPTKISTASNISDEEKSALRELKLLTKSDIEIKKADKTNTIVIMNKEDYREQLVQKCHLETSSYEQARESCDKKVYKDLKKFCTKHNTCLTKSEKDAILDEDWATSNLYVLPKINKSPTIISEISKIQDEYIQMPMPDDLKSRPIVSGPKSVTRGISKLLEKVLTPLVATIRSYIKDERDFLRKFPSNIGTNSHIVCCDVVSLYTSIPNELGLQAVEYWIGRLKSMIPSRITKEFIMEGTSFVLENNYFNFNGTTWRQKIGTAMGKEVASPYACLTIGFLEETILFPRLIPSHFDNATADEIINNFYRFVDDGINPIPEAVSADDFKNVMNKMNPAIQYTVTESQMEQVKDKHVKCNIFLSLKVITTENGDIQTDIHYKETNTHDYLSYDSHHPQHVKDNIPYVLAKNIIVSTTDSDTMENNLRDLKVWLRKCKYPIDIINRGVHNARLQGPANAPSCTPTIPFISTYFSNFDSSNILETTRNLIQNSTNTRIQEVFKDMRFVHARRQPPNILRQLSSAAFIQGDTEKNPGIHLCGRSNCKICEKYLQPCKTFKTTNGAEWNIKSKITCRSLNVLYYQVCNFCNKVAKTGKTDNFRDRTNNHISGARYGNGSDIFDNHVYQCSRNNNMPHDEPYFKLYAYMEVNDYSKLRNIERKLHLQGHDTINQPHSTNS